MVPGLSQELYGVQLQRSCKMQKTLSMDLPQTSGPWVSVLHEHARNLVQQLVPGRLLRCPVVLMT